MSPLDLDVEKLFLSPGMLDSEARWKKAGFNIIRAHETRMLVASHPSVSGLLFKKYPVKSKRSPQEQIHNYERRIEGSRRIRAVIDAQRLRHVIAPQKWIVKLSPRFGEHEGVLVVERCKIVDTVRSRILYRDIDEDALRDLVRVLFHFGGNDSSAKNVPFTKDGKLAFIDTDRWEEPTREKLEKRTYMRFLRKHLSNDRLKFAWKVWDDLLRDTRS